MKWIVYCTTCLINGKIYIGVHKTENPDVFDGYIGGGIEVGWSLPHPTCAFHRALKKHGYKNFKRSTLHVFDDEKSAYDKEAEIVNLEFIKRRDNYNTKLGGIHGEYYDYIYKYDFDGNLISEHLGISLLAKEMNCHWKSLSMACKLKRGFKGFYWSKTKFDKLDVSEYRNIKWEVIYQFDIKGNFLKEWYSIKDICEEYNTTVSNIYSALNKKSQAKGFYFTRDKEKIHDIIKSREIYNTLPKLNPGNPRKIAQYDLAGNLIKVWDSVKECAKSFSKCRDCAKGIRKQTKGYTFKYIVE